jgi:hypothetical protein
MASESTVKRELRAWRATLPEVKAATGQVCPAGRDLQSYSHPLSNLQDQDSSGVISPSISSVRKSKVTRVFIDLRISTQLVCRPA